MIEYILYLIIFSNWYALNVLQKLEKSSNIHQKIFILKICHINPNLTIRLWILPIYCFATEQYGFSFLKKLGKTKTQKFKPKLRSKQTENENDETDEIEELEIKLNNAELPDDAQKVAMKEMKRLKKMSPQMPEYPMLRHYLELIADLPWQKSTVDKIGQYSTIV